MCFLLFCAINILYRYYVYQMEFFAPRPVDLLYLSLITASLFSPFSFKPYLAFLALLSLIPFRIQQHHSVYQLMLAAASLLISVYFSIYYPPWNFIGTIATMVLMLPRKLSAALIGVGLGLLAWCGGLEWLGRFMEKAVI